MPSKTATGTIAIQVTDTNDHCPTLASTHTDLCSNNKTVYVTGIDEDVSPNAAPFTFTIIPDGTRGSWDVEVINGKKKQQQQKTFQFVKAIVVIILFFSKRLS